jgi:HK97 family phage major capsid protein
MTAKELREKRAQVINQSRQFLDKVEAENRDFNAEEQKQWGAFNTEIDNLGTRIERLEAQEKREAEMKSANNLAADIRRDAPGSAVGNMANDPDQIPEHEARSLAVQGWFIKNSDDDEVREQLTERHRRAMKQTGIGRNNRELRIPLGACNKDGLTSIRDFAKMRGALRASMKWDPQEGRYVNVNPLSSLIGAGGGALIPEGFAQEFETAQLAYGYMLQVAEVMRTPMANPIPWPTANDTSNKGRLLTQNAQVNNTGANIAYPTFGAKVFYAYKFTSDEVLVPFELIRDNAVGLTNWLGEALGIRLGRAANDYWTTGTGNNQPTGIVPECLNYGNAAQTTLKANTLQYDDLITLEHAVDPAYRLNNPKAGYMCHDLIIAYLRKIKDGEGRYLWQQSANSGEPDRLNNRPLTRNQSMDSTVASGKKILLFGELSKYKIRMVGDVRMYRLVERYRDNDQDAFLAFQEVDGGLIDAGTHPVKLLQVT